MAATRTNSKSAVKDAILAAAADQFHARGFAATSMQAIAEAVGLSRPALYHHFESKQDIVSALVEEVTLRTLREATRIAETSHAKEPADVFRDLVYAHALWILNRPQQFSVLQYEERQLPEPLFKQQHEAKRQLLDQLRAVLERGIESGSFRNVDPMITSLCVFGMCNSTAEWFKSGGHRTAEQVAGMLVDYASGMVTRPINHEAHKDDAMGWLAVLSDDVAHLRRVLSAPADAQSTSQPSKAKGVSRKRSVGR